MTLVARCNRTSFHDYHHNASKSVDHPITVNRKSTITIDMTDGNQSLVPWHHSINCNTNSCRTSVFPDGRHVAYPAIFTTTTIQPIFIPLTRNLPSNTTTKPQNPKHTNAGDELTHYRANKLNFVVESADARILHIGTMYSTRDHVQPWVQL